MTAPVVQVSEDFDRIALVSEQHGGPLDFYNSRLLQHIPARCDSALDVGCGTGAFTRLLAMRAARVVGIDLSPEMLRLARKHSSSHTNIDFVHGDIMRLSLSPESYDCIASIATLHHLPTEQALLKMKGLLKPGGVLVIHDLIADDSLLDLCRSALAYPLNYAMRFWKTGRLTAPRALREAWAEHGKHDVYLTMTEVLRMCERYLPGATVRRHLFWRYTLVWRKGGASV